MNETIGIRLPDGEHASLRIPVKYTEDDIDIALRVARSFKLGSILTIDGRKFKILGQDPPQVEEVKKTSRSSAPPKTEEAPASERKLIAVQVGQRWVTKDSRRKQEPFEIVRVEDDVLITDKGAKIGLHRMSRYKLVS